jgi:hypothetical protein
MILGQNERGWNWAAEFDYFEFGLKELDSSQKDLYFQTKFELDSK